MGEEGERPLFFRNILEVLKELLETSLPGALYREFREFMRILMTVLGETPPKVYQNSHKRPKPEL